MSSDTQIDNDQAVQSPPSITRRVLLSPGNIWRVGLTVIGLLALASFLWFIIDDGGSVIFTVLMAWFASIAMEPAVSRLAKRMKRGIATGLVMLGVLVFIVLFSFMFGQLLIEQIALLVKSIPDLIASTLEWANQQFNMELTKEDILKSVGLDSDKINELAVEVGANVLGILGSVLGSVFSIFTLGLFTFYLSADAPRFRRWLAGLFPAKGQGVFINIWDITAQKTGGYVAARVILAALNGGSSAVVFLFIGMPYWLALGVWTGLVAQFVPTIGTYIAITLPVIVGLLSGSPWIGIAALVWALIYQQVENLTFEPKISAKAVDVHPAVAFGSVLMGAALFGIAGAILAIPVMAMMLSLLGIYRKRYQLLPEIRDLDSEGATEGEIESKVNEVEADNK